MNRVLSRAKNGQVPANLRVLAPSIGRAYVDYNISTRAKPVDYDSLNVKKNLIFRCQHDAKDVHVHMCTTARSVQSGRRSGAVLLFHNPGCAHHGHCQYVVRPAS